MITQRLYLKTPQNDTSLLLLELRNNGEKIRLSTGVILTTAYWDNDNKTLKNGHPNQLLYTQKIVAFNSIVAKEILIAEANNISLSELKKAILFATGKIEEKKDVAELYHFYKWWAQNSFGEHHPTRQNWNHCVVFGEYLAAKGLKDIPFSAVDYNFYIDFRAFLDNNKGYKPNTTATHLRDLKAVLSEAKNRGMHDSDAYKAIKKKFENVDSVYLTMEEIDKLYKFRLSGVRQMARDLFILGCHTAMRYSDYSKLHPLHISNGKITYKTQKTDETVIIPAHPRVVKILEIWGKAPNVSQTSLNKLIKEICKDMGIFNQLVPIKDGRKTEYIERYNLISTHTARRSGATNMYLSGIPAQSIMKITGHSSESSFMKYLRITKEQNANLLADNPFFKK